MKYTFDIPYKIFDNIWLIHVIECPDSPSLVLYKFFISSLLVNGEDPEDFEVILESNSLKVSIPLTNFLSSMNSELKIPDDISLIHHFEASNQDNPYINNKWDEYFLFDSIDKALNFLLKKPYGFGVFEDENNT